jgi:alpha-tubulin suppressor-like RCC1 family protein
MGDPPRLVDGGLKFAAITGGWTHDCALTASGEAYCWGRNSHGALGDGTSTDSPGPRRVQGGLHFSSISAGWNFTCGLTADGKVYCWAADLNNTGENKPTLVPGETRFTTIDVSHGRGKHACGVATSGGIYCWGSNDHGQLANGSITSDYTTTPRPIVGGPTAAPLASNR